MRITTSITILVTVFAFAGLAMGEDEALGWSQWRGARRDGRTGSFQLPSAWPGGIQEAWKVEVGEGHSSPPTWAHPLFHGTRIWIKDRTALSALDLE